MPPGVVGFVVDFRRRFLIAFPVGLGGAVIELGDSVMGVAVAGVAVEPDPEGNLQGLCFSEPDPA